MNFDKGFEINRKYKRIYLEAQKDERLGIPIKSTKIIEIRK